MADLWAGLRKPLIRPAIHGAGMHVYTPPTGHPPARGAGTPFTPPTAAPPGSYDPQLDWQGQSANQGFQFSAGEYDAANANRKAGVFGGDFTYVDPQTGQQTTVHAPGSLAELMTQHDAAIGRANQSHDTQTADLSRSFGNLARSQTQSAYQTGQQQGGYQQAAAQARAGNQGRAQGRLDQSWRDIVNSTNQATDTRRTGILANLAEQQGNADLSFGESKASNTTLNEQLAAAKIADAQQRGNLPTIQGGQYAVLPPGSPVGSTGVPSRTFAGVEYGATPGNTHLSPVAGQKASAESVMSTGSLLGTGLEWHPTPVVKSGPTGVPHPQVAPKPPQFGFGGARHPLFGGGF